MYDHQIIAGIQVLIVYSVS